MKEVTIPIGPGKGQVKPVMEALQMVIMEMRGHVNDLRDSGEEARAELLECYTTALELIWQEGMDQISYGVGMPARLIRLAKKYHLVLPVDYLRK